MDTNDTRIKSLIIKYLKDELNETEKRELEQWVNASDRNHELFTELTDTGRLSENLREFHEARNSVWNKISKTLLLDFPQEAAVIRPIQEESLLIQRGKPKIRRTWLYAAACVSLLLAGSYFWHSIRKTGPANGTAKNISPADVAPGKDIAILQLEDGKKIRLDSAGNGPLAQQGKAAIVKLSTGELTYQSNVSLQTRTGDREVSDMDHPTSTGLSFNILSTPKAGQYRLTLPDGTRIWLNNASRLRYPTTFEGKERVVELSGEAYFEVAQLRAQSSEAGSGKQLLPFKVLVSPPSGGEAVQVEVLGTHFNIMAYGDEADIRTTLLEGKVRVIQSLKQETMHPGEQISISKNKSWIVTKSVDADQVIAWTNGFFHFDHADLKAVMRQLARWYDITVTYEGNISSQVYQGDIKRDLTISQVLENLGDKNIHFRIEGKNVVIAP